MTTLKPDDSFANTQEGLQWKPLSRQPAVPHMSENFSVHSGAKFGDDGFSLTAALKDMTPASEEQDLPTQIGKNKGSAFDF